MRPGAREGARAAAITLGVLLASVAPARWVVAGLDAVGFGRVTTVALGLIADVPVLALPSVALAALLGEVARRSRRAAQAALLANAIAAWAGGVSASE